MVDVFDIRIICLYMHSTALYKQYIIPLYPKTMRNEDSFNPQIYGWVITPKNEGNETCGEMCSCPTWKTAEQPRGCDWKMGLPEGGSDFRWEGSKGSVQVSWWQRGWETRVIVRDFFVVGGFFTYLVSTNAGDIDAFLKVHSKRQISVFKCTVSTSMYIAWIDFVERERETKKTNYCSQ